MKIFFFIKPNWWWTICLYYVVEGTNKRDNITEKCLYLKINITELKMLRGEGGY